MVCCDQARIEERFKKKAETEELNEEQQNEIAEDTKNNKAKRGTLAAHFEAHKGRVNIIEFSSDASLETTVKSLNNRFSPKIILVNHEKKLPVDTACANLALKYNMIYVSAYQVIKHHVTQKTEWGKKLMACETRRPVSDTLLVKDEFEEAIYSPIHYDIHVVMQLLRDTIATMRTSQKFVLLEGLCNSTKLSDIDDQLELRFMDEFFGIELIVGEVAAVVSLQYEK